MASGCALMPAMMACCSNGALILGIRPLPFQLIADKRIMGGDWLRFFITQLRRILAGSVWRHRVGELAKGKKVLEVPALSFCAQKTKSSFIWGRG